MELTEIESRVKPVKSDGKSTGVLYSRPLRCPTERRSSGPPFACSPSAMVSGYICSAWKCESLGSSCDRPRVFKFLGPASLRLVNQVLGDPSLLHLGWFIKTVDGSTQ